MRGWHTAGKGWGGGGQKPEALSFPCSLGGTRLWSLTGSWCWCPGLLRSLCNVLFLAFLISSPWLTFGSWENTFFPSEPQFLVYKEANDRMRGGGRLNALALLSHEVPPPKRTVESPPLWPLHSRELQPMVRISAGGWAARANQGLQPGSPSI